MTWFNLVESESDKKLVAKWKSEQGTNIPLLSEKDIPLSNEWLPIPIITNDKPISKRQEQKEKLQEKSLLEIIIHQKQKENKLESRIQLKDV